MPSASYPVRTPLLYWAVLGAITVLSLFVVGLVLYSLRVGISPLLDLVGLFCLALPFLYFATTREYRAHGVIHLDAGEVSVPDARGRPLQFRSPGMRIEFTRVAVRVTVMHIPVGDVARGVVIDLADALNKNKRRISTLTLVDQDHKDDLLDDLERVLRGEPPRGPNPRPVAPRPHNELEAQLDRELAALD